MIDEELNKRMETQSAEFDAMDDLSKAWRTLTMVAIVDDDYPMVRHRYESCLQTFITKLRENGRFDRVDA